MQGVTKRELRQRWLDLRLGVTEREAKGLVRQGIFTGHDANVNIIRLLAYRAGMTEAQRKKR